MSLSGRTCERIVGEVALLIRLVGADLRNKVPRS